MEQCIGWHWKTLYWFHNFAFERCFIELGLRSIWILAFRKFSTVLLWHHNAPVCTAYFTVQGKATKEFLEWGTSDASKRVAARTLAVQRAWTWASPWFAAGSALSHTAHSQGRKGELIIPGNSPYHIPNIFIHHRYKHNRSLWFLYVWIDCPGDIWASVFWWTSTEQWHMKLKMFGWLQCRSPQLN